MRDLIGFWSYALAACAFASVTLWRLRSRVDRSDQLLLGACFVTAVWAVIAGVCGREAPLTMIFGNLRSLAWVILLYDMSAGVRSQASRGLRLVFGAVALVIGLSLVLSLLSLAMSRGTDEFEQLLAASRLLRITMSAGILVLVHNVYGHAAPDSRVRIRGPMLGLTLMFGYDLNLATVAYLRSDGAGDLYRLRGLFLALTAPFFTSTGGAKDSLKIKLSRAATFQSLSLFAICCYLATMAVLAGTFRSPTWGLASAGSAFLFLLLVAGAATLVLSEHARGWIKVKLAKHLFEHRYDYRSEWLRFTETLGRSGPEAAPLGDRIVNAFAAIVDSPGGLLLVNDAGGTIAAAAAWNWPGAHPPAGHPEADASFWSEVEARGRIIEFEALRRGWGDVVDRSLAVPTWMLEDPCVWAGIPLVHHNRLVGIVLLAAPEYRRPLDWEDFDLLRTAGRQAASSLAEAHGQEALSNAQRFEEFNRRFAFILHDVKNLVSQLSLLARNAERHAENPEFRADMIATLKSSVGKMNDLLARLSPHTGARVSSTDSQPLRPLLIEAIAGKRRNHEVRLTGETNRHAEVDAAAFEQAIGHLLQNAIEASPANEPVTVRVTERGETVAISIIDKGCGMDVDFVRNRLFQPFSSTKQGGFGVGAFEARSLLVAMGGRVSVDSRPGKGTTFTILLPASQSRSEPAGDKLRISA
ncbi:XrtA/PEP-CTERM system histidine kinase PrsK [Sphingomonas sp.]|uniref:XrtA/PEP-CTERM system histidine kinase PrsK n=1 Tax=Sphingomonas sp. TaxID=28214 RepID=UPI0025F5C462|nr:XrtA/PEP-CTERM system histidine kinase PrsK [Sphingomonas sp.]MBV9528315.1 PEP-CTERM system histidine kinase PrsK [Sphingomonas sp.]